MGNDKLCRANLRGNYLVGSQLANPLGNCLRLIIFSVLNAAVGGYLLIWFQSELRELRKRIAAASDYAFGPNEKIGLKIATPDPDPFWRGWQILASLMGVCIAGMILAVMAIATARPPNSAATPASDPLGLCLL